MEWWEALLMGVVQGLTEFLPVSSSGHLMIFRELLGVDPEGFLDFTVTVHFATVLSTIAVFWAAIVKILKGVLKFKYNDETDYFLKICVSMVPVAVVGFCFKDAVEALFGEGVLTVAVCLLITAALLCFSDFFRFRPRAGKEYRNGISYWQAALVGLGQACAVAPGLSRSGTTIATGLVCGVKGKIWPSSPSLWCWCLYSGSSCSAYSIWWVLILPPLPVSVSSLCCAVSCPPSFRACLPAN